MGRRKKTTEAVMEEKVEDVKEEGREKVKPEMITVRAVGKDIGQVVGYSKYNTRIRAGEVFQIEKDKFSKRWMEKVSDGTESVVPDEQGREQTPFSKTNAITGEKKEI